jgi:hypothetical protein
MIEYREEPTVEDQYSMGRSQMSEREIWDVEDNGGFKKVIISGNVTNLQEYRKDSVSLAIEEYRERRMDCGQAVVVFALGPDFELDVNKIYGKVTKIVPCADNTYDVEITLLDTPSGNTIWNLVKGCDLYNLDIEADGLCLNLPTGKRFTNLLNFKIEVI